MELSIFTNVLEKIALIFEKHIFLEIFEHFVLTLDVNFHVCFDERHIFRATKSAKIKKQNKKVSTFGQKSAQLPEVIYLQSDLVEVTFFFQNYSKTSI